MNKAHIILLCLAACLPVTSFATAQGQDELDLMPMPAQVELGQGELPVDQSFSVAITGHREPRLERAVERLLRDLTQVTGIPLERRPVEPAKATLALRVAHSGKAVQEPGEDESYELTVTPSGAQLTSSTPLGALHGMQTLLQLVRITPKGFAAPVLTIRDRPRFVWRGLLIDVSRHFIQLETLKRNLDGMAAVKMNVLHLHLSDNEGFRVESKRFPRLHLQGSEGMYYTQPELRELVAYARDRGIRIVPEFDMPGHSRAWFVGYPELASAPGPYKVERAAGKYDPAMDPTKESTYKFLGGFIREMAGIFPDRYFHIGGDEVNAKDWDANPRIQQFIRRRGMKSNADLQAYFNQRLNKLLSSQGKIMVGWDEVLHPDLPASIVVQSWRGQESLAASARQGYRGLLSHGYYLDLMWPAHRHYAADPMTAAASLTQYEKQRILGGEACMWTEYVSDDIIDSRIWPRLAAVAERLWSPQDIRDPDSMYRRLETTSSRLEWLGLTHKSSYLPMLRRMAGGDDINPLRTLGDAVEPVKDYARMEAHAWLGDRKTPLNRLVDAVPPESETGRRFEQLVNTWLTSGRADAKSEREMRAFLNSWAHNYQALGPLLERSFLIKELEPLSERLAAIGTAGLGALDFMARNERSPDQWRTEQLASAEEAAKPVADLLLVVAPSVRILIEASARRGTAPAP